MKNNPSSYFSQNQLNTIILASRVPTCWLHQITYIHTKRKKKKKSIRRYEVKEVSRWKVGQNGEKKLMQYLPIHIYRINDPLSKFVATTRHFHIGFDHLKKFLRRRNSPSLKFAPHAYSVKVNFKGACTKESLLY